MTQSFSKVKIKEALNETIYRINNELHYVYIAVFSQYKTYCISYMAEVGHTDQKPMKAERMKS